MCSISPAHFFARDGSLARKRASLSWEKRTRASLFLARPRRSIGRAPRVAHSPARPPRARGALRARHRDFERARCPPFRPRRRRSLAPRARRFADSSSIAVPPRATLAARALRLPSASDPPGGLRPVAPDPAPRPAGSSVPPPPPRDPRRDSRCSSSSSSSSSSSPSRALISMRARSPPRPTERPNERTNAPHERSSAPPPPSRGSPRSAPPPR